LPVHLLLTLALDGVEWSASLPDRQERELATYCVEDWVGVRANLDSLEKNLLLVSGFWPWIVQPILTCKIIINNCFTKTVYNELVDVFAAFFFTRQLF